MNRLAVLVCALLLSLPIQAQVPLGDSTWYYDVGGAAPVSAPASYRSSAQLGLNGSLGLGYACGKFDLAQSITATFENAAVQLQGMAQGLLQSVVSGLALKAIAEANPVLYDLIQNTMWRGDEWLRLNMQSCRQIESDIVKNGLTNYEDWVSWSASDKLRRLAEGGGTELTEAVSAPDSSEGVPWVGGDYAGGESTEPVRVVHDVTEAGYNLLLGRDATDTSAPPESAGEPPTGSEPSESGGSIAGSAAPPRLTTVFPTPGAASAWATDVLGDALIRTADGDATESRPGRGLLPAMADELTDVRRGMAAVLDEEGVPTLADLDVVSAPGVAITPGVVLALRSLPASERAVMAGRLAEEVAMARTVEKALLTRRLLLTGRREPHVALSPAGKELGERVLPELQQEIDTLLFENRVRKEIVSHTAGIALRRARARVARDGSAPLSFDRDPYTFRDGAVSSEAGPATTAPTPEEGEAESAVPILP